MQSHGRLSLRGFLGIIPNTTHLGMYQDFLGIGFSQLAISCYLMCEEHQSHMNSTFIRMFFL